ncbi:L-carnitine CoA-transferase [Moorella sulfitireducens (nom. illeg.)]|uniref:L-carnitine CoA-transferase n=1 Tax=Neomoorella sulfitireducens TaxID=2972948 RepID=UPI0021ACCB8C|nr:L-carnitine CoA-transferase [Moorella sulfitireducens]
MAKRTDIPEFGPLSGIKVVHATMSVAGPIAAQLMADYGAEVIWIESPLSPDIARTGTGATAQQDRRNQRTIALNIPSPEGKEIFLKLIEDADIFIETSRGGQYSKWGLTDEVMWERNPRLVIVHISGFGQDGVEEYVFRASYDPVAQAFGCYMQLNGYPDRPPVPAMPVTADYLTGLLALSAGLAALLKAKETGKGESIDVAQYEALMRFQNNFAVEYLNHGKKPVREGNHSSTAAGYGSYTCKDGKEVYMLFLGGGVLKNGLSFLGLEYGSKDFPARMPVVFLGTPGGEKLEARIKEYCASKTAAEVEKELNAVGVPCSMVMDYETAVNHPHYQAREVFVEWEKVNGEKFKGINVFPKFKNNPGRIWRGAPGIGMDNEDILSELGYSPEDIEELYKKKVIIKG